MFTYYNITVKGVIAIAHRNFPFLNEIPGNRRLQIQLGTKYLYPSWIGCLLKLEEVKSEIILYHNMDYGKLIFITGNASNTVGIKFVYYHNMDYIADRFIHQNTTTSIFVQHIANIFFIEKQFTGYSRYMLQLFIFNAFLCNFYVNIRFLELYRFVSNFVIIF